MIIDLNEINNGILEEITFKEKLNFTKDDLKNTKILEIDEVLVEGNIHKIGIDSYELFLKIKTTIYLEDSLTLEKIDYPLDLSILKRLGETDDEEEYYKIFNNSLDILPIVWENIVLEVPLRIVKEEKDTVIEGDGWSLNKVEENSPLSELKELLDMEEKK